MLTRIIGPKRDEVGGSLRRLYSEELYNLHPSPCINRILKSRRMRWAGHLAGMRKKRKSRKKETTRKTQT
jgi:hypothetical protein